MYVLGPHVLKACTLLNVGTQRALGVIAGPFRQAIACHPRSGLLVVPSTLCLTIRPGQIGKALHYESRLGDAINVDAAPHGRVWRPLWSPF